MVAADSGQIQQADRVQTRRPPRKRVILPPAMPGKFTFQMTSDDRRRPLPHKILLGQRPTESVRHVFLKFLAWVLFHRDRLVIEGDTQNDAIPFEPDLLQLGYDMRPQLWIECGECSATKLDKLSVKCPEAAIWVVKASVEEALALLRVMQREEFRTGRYGIIALDPEMVQEAEGLIRERNSFHWYRGELEQARMQFDLNGLWFDHAFDVFRH